MNYKKKLRAHFIVLLSLAAPACTLQASNDDHAVSHRVQEYLENPLMLSDDDLSFLQLEKNYQYIARFVLENSSSYTDAEMCQIIHFLAGGWGHHVMSFSEQLADLALNHIEKEAPECLREEALWLLWRLLNLGYTPQHPEELIPKLERLLESSTPEIRAPIYRVTAELGMTSDLLLDAMKGDMRLIDDPSVGHAVHSAYYAPYVFLTLEPELIEVALHAEDRDTAALAMRALARFSELRPVELSASQWESLAESAAGLHNAGKRFFGNLLINQTPTEPNPCDLLSVVGLPQHLDWSAEIEANLGCRLPVPGSVDGAEPSP